MHNLRVIANGLLIGLGLFIMQLGINGYKEGKGKDKEALFNVTYYFNSLGHEILCDITKYPFTDTYLTLSS